jgi:hypothetical protein
VRGEEPSGRYQGERQMKRRLFNILAAVSLVMALAVAGLWVRSYWRDDFVSARLINVGIAGSSQKGSTGFFLLRPSLSSTFITWETRSENSPTLFVASSWDSLCQWRWGGFGLCRVSTSKNEDLSFIIIPHWFWIAAGLILPLSWTWQQRRVSQRQDQHLCPACGYDLRASKDACPECGAKIQAVNAPNCNL